MSLPPLSETIKSNEARDSPLAQSLAILFEPSEILYNRVVPALVPNISSYKSYKDLIDASIAQISQLTLADQTDFIAGHPRIGEVSGLSALSAAEQASKATPPAVLKRLGHLNLLYEKRYPGLVYITFVAGRSRAEIIPEMEGILGIGSAEEEEENEPPVESIRSVEVGGEEWKSELNRAVVDVGRIAKSRLEKMDVE